MKIKKIITATLLFLFFATISNPSHAVNINKITKIKIQGTERIGPEIVKSYLEVKKYGYYNKKKVNQSLKNLYQTELFEDVQITFKWNTLIVKVKENPIISDIVFEGNKSVNDDILMGEISLYRRAIFSKTKLKKDVQKIISLYEKSGRFLATVEPKIIKKKDNRVTLIFEIHEGKKAKVKKIFIIGNEKFNDDKLKDIIFTKEAKFLGFSAGELYDPERLEYDKELLRRFYFSKGYADFEIISLIGEITPKKDGFYITILIKEGVKYNFGKISVTNHIKKFDKTLVEKKIKIKEGQVFNADRMNKTIDKMIEEMGKHGYAFVDVEPKTTKNRENRIIDINFIIHPTRKVYIGRINIIGNTRTLDEVIRRELRIQEGDPYNSTKILRSKQRLQNLGYFKRVEINKTTGDQLNKVDLTIEVKEQKTGELNMGVGYSTVEGANVNLGIREKNVLGTGRKLSLDWMRSESVTKTTLGYGKPYFLNREVFAGFDVFYKKVDDKDSIDYDKKSYGGSVDFSYEITEYLTHKVFYSNFKEEIYNISPLYSGSLDDTKKTTSLIGESFYYDRRDSKFEPHKGIYLNWNTSRAGLGGDKHYLSNTGTATGYIPVIFDELVFKTELRGGYIDGTGEPIAMEDAFYLGGYSFRGFKPAGIGPRTVNSTTNSAKGGSAIGGKEYYIGEAEIRFPLGLPREYRIFGSFFANSGTLTGVDDGNSVDKTRIIDDKSLRAACGFSVSWSSPIGPIVLDFAKILEREEYDVPQNFNLGFRGSF